jgi:prophage regulatory protein
MTAAKQFLRLPDVIKMVGKSRTAIYRDIQGGTFPAPIRIGARAVAWDSTAIETWQQARISASIVDTCSSGKSPC